MKKKFCLFFLSNETETALKKVIKNAFNSATAAIAF